MLASLKKRVKYLIQDYTGVELRRVGRRGHEKLPIHVDPLFKELYRTYYRDTMVPWTGLYTAFLAAKYVARNVDGAIVECGVFKGGCSAIMAETLARFGSTHRPFFLYDTYTGMSEPSDSDFKQDALPARDVWRERQRDGYVDWCYGSLEHVQEVMRSTDYPFRNLNFIQGLVEETIPRALPPQIALLRLDTDFYESTKHELEYLYDLVIDNGVVIIDDYAAWNGARQAVDEFFQRRDIVPFITIDSHYGAMSFIKSTKR